MPLIGLMLNFTPLGIRIDPLVLSLALFTIVFSMLARQHRYSLTSNERFSINFSKVYAKVKDFTPGKISPDRQLSLILIILIFLSTIMVAYVIVMPRRSETYTEIYILGPDGNAIGLPTKFMLGENKSIIAGVENYELKDMSYVLIER